MPALSINPMRLGAMHVTLGIWTAVAAAAVPLLWKTELPASESIAPVLAAAQPAFWCIAAYCVVTATVHADIGWRLRSGRASPSGVLGLAVVHGSLFAVVLRIALRNPHSPAYLAGLDAHIAIVLVTSLLCAALLLSTWAAGSVGSAGLAGRSVATRWTFYLLQTLAATATAIALLRVDATLG